MPEKPEDGVAGDGTEAARSNGATVNEAENGTYSAEDENQLNVHSLSVEQRDTPNLSEKSVLLYLLLIALLSKSFIASFYGNLYRACILGDDAMSDLDALISIFFIVMSLVFGVSSILFLLFYLKNKSSNHNQRRLFYSVCAIAVILNLSFGNLGMATLLYLTRTWIGACIGAAFLAILAVCVDGFALHCLSAVYQDPDYLIWF